MWVSRCSGGAVVGLEFESRGLLVLQHFQLPDVLLRVLAILFISFFRFVLPSGSGCATGVFRGHLSEGKGWYRRRWFLWIIIVTIVRRLIRSRHVVAFVLVATR